MTRPASPWHVPHAMKTLLFAAAVASCMFFLQSCGKEETIKGRSVTAWIERLDDRDAKTRLEAADALLKASPDALKPAKKRLLELANQPGMIIDGTVCGDKAAAQIVLEEKFGMNFR